MREPTPKRIRGHFSFVLAKGAITGQTTVTSQVKSKARLLEHAKRLKVLGEIENLTKSHASGYARSYDGVNRRWGGVKSNGPNG